MNPPSGTPASQRHERKRRENAIVLANIVTQITYARYRLPKQEQQVALLAAAEVAAAGSHPASADLDIDPADSGLVVGHGSHHGHLRVRRGSHQYGLPGWQDQTQYLAACRQAAAVASAPAGS